MWVDEVRIGRKSLRHRSWHLQLTQKHVRKFLSKRQDILISFSHDQYYEIHRIINILWLALYRCVVFSKQSAKTLECNSYVSYEVAEIFTPKFTHNELCTKWIATFFRNLIVRIL